MALKILWSAKAKEERKGILKFYLERNKSPDYSRELARHFDAGVELVSVQERMGKPTIREGIRCLFILNYSLFYVVKEETVVVLSVWDNHRDPDKRPY